MAEGDLLMIYKKPALAAAAYEKALAINKNQSVLMKLHGALLQSGKGKEANSRLFQWLKEHPADTSVRMYLAQFYLANGESKPAIEQYQTILRQYPGYVPALNNLATTYHQKKDPLALEYAEKAYQQAPDSPAILDTLGWILIEQDNIARGLPLLQKATSLAPEMAEIRYHFAAGLLKSGDKTRARKELEQLLSKGEQFASVNEARLLLKQIQ
jgi:putative PEP-CTERM system TPR-repeat lipoprotein